MILYIFIDGIGFGNNDPEKNPFAKFAKGFFLPLANRSFPENSPFNKAVYVKTDASMGVKGLPQSATGQSSIWTGVNCPRALNRHVSGYPSFTLKKIIDAYSVIKIFNNHGFKSSFVNCYSPPYLDHIRKNRKFLSASTLVQMAAGLELNTFEDLMNDRGIYMDITHEFLREYAKDFLPPDHPLLTIRDPFSVGKNLVKISRNHDLAIYEYFITDKVGHAKDWKKAESVIYSFERFMDGIMEEISQENEQVILTSDHGNLEDLSSGVHTINLVPTFLYGKYTNLLKDKIHALNDIVPAIYEIFNIDVKPSWEEVNLEI